MALFLIYRENSWEAAKNALIKKKKNYVLFTCLKDTCHFYTKVAKNLL
jgi:hypothetical protein